MANKCSQKFISFTLSWPIELITLSTYMAYLFLPAVLSQFAHAVPAHGEAHAEEQATADGHDDDVGVCCEEGQGVVLALLVTLPLLVQ